MEGLQTMGGTLGGVTGSHVRRQLWGLHFASKPSLRDSGVEAVGVSQERRKERINNNKGNTSGLQ